jgi:hypothetical protein
MSFWAWFFKGSGAGPGVLKVIDRWLFIHLLIGVSVAALSPTEMCSAAKGLLLPLASIFVGLSFAWGGNAQALLQTKEIEDLTQQHKGGFEEYIYTYQLSILLILIALVSWGIAGLDVFDKVWPTAESSKTYFILESTLFFLASLAIRECWHVVLGAHAMLLVKHKISKINNDKIG